MANATHNTRGSVTITDPQGRIVEDDNRRQSLAKIRDTFMHEQKRKSMLKPQTLEELETMQRSIRSERRRSSIGGIIQLNNSSNKLKPNRLGISDNDIAKSDLGIRNNDKMDEEDIKKLKEMALTLPKWGVGKNAERMEETPANSPTAKQAAAADSNNNNSFGKMMIEDDEAFLQPMLGGVRSIGGGTGGGDTLQQSPIPEEDVSMLGDNANNNNNNNNNNSNLQNSNTIRSLKEQVEWLEDRLLNKERTITDLQTQINTLEQSKRMEYETFMERVNQLRNKIGSKIVNFKERLDSIEDNYFRNLQNQNSNSNDNNNDNNNNNMNNNSDSNNKIQDQQIQKELFDKLQEISEKHNELYHENAQLKKQLGVCVCVCVFFFFCFAFAFAFALLFFLIFGFALLYFFFVLDLGFWMFGGVFSVLLFCVCVLCLLFFRLIL